MAHHVAPLDADAAGLFVRFLGSSERVCAVQTDHAGVITAVNAAFCRAVKRDAADLQGLAMTAVLTVGAETALEAARHDPEGTPFLLHVNTADHRPFTLRCLYTAGPEGATLICEPVGAGDVDAVEALQATQRQMQAALDDLQSMYWHVRKMQEYLPICMQCGKVKASETTWTDAATFLQKQASFLTHGCCPSCADRFLADLADFESGRGDGQ
jgi:hypothetical protein